MAAQTSTRAQAKINSANADAQTMGYSEIPHISASAASMAAAQDVMSAMGIKMPSWKQVAFGMLTFLAISAAAYIAAPVLASILVAGTMTVTASGFALWCASAIGYIVTVLLAWKSVKVVSAAAQWLSKLSFAVQQTA